ncbi:hypothetical protein BDD12DRAFT_699097, partial [Trichophaea hybrida]
VPTYRGYDGTNSNHFYTTDRNEIDRVIPPYAAESVGWYMYPTAIPGTVPLYRFYNSADGDHVYSTNS